MLDLRHAGYRYSGANAAHAYQYLEKVKEQVKRIFLLGPSHHEPFTGCMLPSAKIKEYSTPLGNIKLDTEIISTLAQNEKLWKRLTVSTDEDEHSLEMHLPYIYHTMSGCDFTLVPIMVGSLASQLETSYGHELAPYLDDESNFFIVSSDFCHWGRRFSYTPYAPKNNSTPIHQYISSLDHDGMKAIEEGKAESFRNYLKETSNTICGRNPILVLLSTTQQATQNSAIKFIKYDQSSQAVELDDASVSYASALVFEKSAPSSS